MDQHLQEAFLRGFERGLEKDAAISAAVYGVGRGLLVGGRALGGLARAGASRVGNWATTYKGTGLPTSITNRVRPAAGKAWKTIKREVPGTMAQAGTNMAMGKVFEQPKQPQGTQPGSMFQPGQRTIT